MGMQWAIQNPDAAIDLVVSTYPALKKSVVSTELPALMQFWVTDAQRKNGLLWMDSSTWQPTYQILVDHNVITKPYAVSEVINTQHLPTPPVTP